MARFDFSDISGGLIVESIKFQTYDFINELEAEIIKIKNEYNKKHVSDRDFYASDALEDFKGIIKKYTNITIETIAQGEPAVFIPLINGNHIFFKEPIRELFREPTIDFTGTEDLKKYFKDKKTDSGVGTVDIRTGTVSGMYAELKITMLLPFVDFTTDRRMSPREFAAVILHEVGHVYTYMEYVDRTVTTNQILFNMLTELEKSNNDEQTSVKFIKYAKALELNDEEAQVLAKQRDPKVISIIAMNASVEKSRSELGGMNVYDYNDCEALADQFSMRCGAGSSLASGLDKIITDAVGRPGTGKRLFYQARGVLYHILLTAATALLDPHLAIFMNVYVVVIMIIIIACGTREENYDRNGARMTRMKNELITRIKDQSLDKVEKENIINYIAEIEKLAEIYKKSDDDGLLMMLSNFFRSSVRFEKKVIELQKQLERIASNDLFVSAAKLSTI